MNLALCFTKSLKGSIILLVAKAQDTWLTKPNQDLAPWRFLGVGKSLIAERISSEGDIPFEVIFRPANFTVSWQN